MADEDLTAPRLTDPVMMDLDVIRDALNALDSGARMCEQLAVMAEQQATVITQAFRRVASIMEPWLPAESDSPTGVKESET